MADHRISSEDVFTYWLSLSFTQKMHLLTQSDINNLAIWMQMAEELSERLVR